MEDNMSLLDKVAYPAFAKDPFIRPSARALGAVLVAFNVLSCIRWPPELRPLFPHSFVDTVTPAQILMIVGGIRMMFGDARGRRLVVLSIPIGFIYVVAVAMQAYYPGFARILS